MIDCRNINLKFSTFYSNKRIALANKIIGEKTVKNIIALSFYLLGASRKAVAEFCDIYYDTFKSFTGRIEQEGLSALFDRRIKHLPLTEIKETNFQESQNILVDIKGDYIYINFKSGGNLFKIPSNNSMQVKTILLTLLDNKLISRQSVSEVLNYTPVHIQRLSLKLQNNDLSLFIDQRQGQQKNYICSPEIKTEMFQQFIANLATGRSVSSKTLSENLKERCDIDLSSRTIRYHLEKSGLSKTKKTLPELLGRLKKTSKFNN